MAQQFALTDDTPTYNPRYADAFVVFAVTVLSLAIGVWCLLRLGFALWMGTAAALAAYAVLLAVHLAVRRSLVAADDDMPDREPGDIWMQSPYAPNEPAPHVRGLAGLGCATFAGRGDRTLDPGGKGWREGPGRGAATAQTCGALRFSAQAGPLSAARPASRPCIAFGQGAQRRRSPAPPARRSRR